MNGPLASGAAYSTEIPRTPGYYVYRLWADDECLYVGRVGEAGPRPPQPRLNYHRRNRPWWPEVTRTEVTALPDHPAMVAEEESQIALLRPRYNVNRTRCNHDRSQPGALNANGGCRACAATREKTSAARAAERARAKTPERRAKKRKSDLARRPTKNAARRLQRRAPGSDQGGLW